MRPPSRPVVPLKLVLAVVVREPGGYFHAREGVAPLKRTDEAHRIEDHFVDVAEMVPIGSDAQRPLKTILSRSQYKPCPFTPQHLERGYAFDLEADTRVRDLDFPHPITGDLVRDDDMLMTKRMGNQVVVRNL